MKICGILGVYINAMSDNVIRNLYNILVNQKLRGIKGAGISINNDSKLLRFRAYDPFVLFNVYNKNIWDKIHDGSRVLFHHRYPTSTVNEPKFNHPIANEDKTIHIIHNGVVFNYEEVFKKLSKKHTFETLEKGKKEFTDSEVIVHIFEDGLKSNKGSVKEALKYMYDKLSGSFSVALQIKGDRKIYLVKHNNPIIISNDSKGNHYFSSEFSKESGLKKTREMVEGEIGALTAEGYERIAKMKAKPVKYVYFTDKTYNKVFVDKKKKGGKEEEFADLRDFSYDYGLYGNKYHLGWKDKWRY